MSFIFISLLLFSVLVVKWLGGFYCTQHPFLHLPFFFFKKKVYSLISKTNPAQTFWAL